MPETSALAQLDLEMLTWWNVRDQAQAARSRRDYLIRQSYAEGASFHELSKLTGLSRAQVQRICDYSKDLTISNVAEVRKPKDGEKR